MNAGNEDATLELDRFASGSIEDPEYQSAIDAAILRSEQIKWLKQCPFWIRIGCGCGENRCAAGKGIRGLVFDHDCRECLIP